MSNAQPADLPTIDTSVCYQENSVTAYYEVLHDRVYDVGDAFNGSIQIICPVLNTDYQLFYSICSDYCQSYLDGTIMFNVTSFNDTEDYFPMLTIEPDDLLNIRWHFYAELDEAERDLARFSDPSRRGHVHGQKPNARRGQQLFTLFEEDDPETVPSYVDACVCRRSDGRRAWLCVRLRCRDEDADTVLDKRSPCPDTATGVSVDAFLRRQSSIGHRC